MTTTVPTASPDPSRSTGATNPCATGADPTKSSTSILSTATVSKVLYPSTASAANALKATSTIPFYINV